MKRLGLLAAAVFVILLVAPIAHASAAELHSHWQVASATPTAYVTIRAAAETAVPGGWTDDDSVWVAGIGALFTLGAAAITARASLDSSRS
jgi:hypothetical protein